MSSPATPATCSSCGRRIIWARDTNGKAIPLERCKPGDGTVGVQLPLLPGGRAVVVSLAVGVRTTYRRHIDTCPAAEVWRQRWKYKAAKKRATRACLVIS